MVLESYSTESFSSADKAEHWSRIISETYFPLHLSYREPGSFNGRLERRNTGPVALSRLRSEALQYERVAGQIRRDEAEAYLITIPRLTPVRFCQLGREVDCGPGGLLVERGDAPYRFSYEARNDLYVVKIARSALSERLREPDRLCAEVFDARSGMAGLFAETVRRAHALPDDPQAAEVLGRHLVELLALSLDRLADCDAGVGTVVRAAHLRRAQEAIRCNLDHPDLSPDLVAQLCGVSKRYLHQIFGETDTTLARYIRDQRLLAARDLLQMPGDLPLADIAYRFGFCDHAQFSRQFRALFGQTPSGYRAIFRRRGPSHPTVN